MNRSDMSKTLMLSIIAKVGIPVYDLAMQNECCSRSAFRGFCRRILQEMRPIGVHPQDTAVAFRDEYQTWYSEAQVVVRDHP